MAETPKRKRRNLLILVIVTCIFFGLLFLFFSNKKRTVVSSSEVDPNKEPTKENNKEEEKKEKEEKKEEKPIVDNDFHFPQRIEGTESIITEFFKAKFRYALSHDDKPKNFMFTQSIGGFGNTMLGMFSSMLYCIFEDCLPLVNVGVCEFAPQSSFFDLFEAIDPELKYYMDLRSPNNPFKKEINDKSRSTIKNVVQFDNAWFFSCISEMCKFLVEDQFIDIEDIVNRRKTYTNNFRSVYKFQNNNKNCVVNLKSNHFLFEHLPRAKKKLEVLCKDFHLCYGNPGEIGFKDSNSPHRSVFEEYSFYMKETNEERNKRFSPIPHPKIANTKSSATIRESYFGAQIFGSVFNELFKLSEAVETKFMKFWKERIEGKFLFVLQMRQHYLPQEKHSDIYGNCLKNSLKRIILDIVDSSPEQKTLDIAFFLSSDKAISHHMMGIFEEEIKKAISEGKEKGLTITVDILQAKDYFEKYFNPNEEEMKYFKGSNFYTREILSKSSNFREFIMWDFELFSRSDFGVSLTSSTYTLLSSGRNKKFFPPQIISIDQTWKPYMDDMKMCHITK